MSVPPWEWQARAKARAIYTRDVSYAKWDFCCTCRVLMREYPLLEIFNEQRCRCQWCMMAHTWCD